MLTSPEGVWEVWRMLLSFSASNFFASSLIGINVPSSKKLYSRKSIKRRGLRLEYRVRYFPLRVLLRLDPDWKDLGKKSNIMTNNTALLYLWRNTCAVNITRIIQRRMILIWWDRFKSPFLIRCLMGKQSKNRNNKKKMRERQIDNKKRRIGNTWLTTEELTTEEIEEDIHQNQNGTPGVTPVTGVEPPLGCRQLWFNSHPWSNASYWHLQ